MHAPHAEPQHLTWNAERGLQLSPSGRGACRSRLRYGRSRTPSLNGPLASGLGSATRALSPLHRSPTHAGSPGELASAAAAAPRPRCLRVRAVPFAVRSCTHAADIFVGLCVARTRRPRGAVRVAIPRRAPLEQPARRARGSGSSRTWRGKMMSVHQALDGKSIGHHPGSRVGRLLLS